MSCYEWEEGTLKVPSSEWSGLKKAVREAWNIYMLDRHCIAQEIYSDLIAKGKGKRKFNYQEVFFESKYSYCDDIFTSLFPENCRKPKKPKKKDFPLAKTTTLSFLLNDEAEIIFNNKSREVSWVIYENNHATRIWNHVVAVKFLRCLNSLRWTSKTGGYFMGSNEYNEDKRPFLTRHFGGVGRRAYEANQNWRQH